METAAGKAAAILNPLYFLLTLRRTHHSNIIRGLELVSFENNTPELN